MSSDGTRKPMGETFDRSQYHRCRQLYEQCQILLLKLGNFSLSSFRDSDADEWWYKEGQDIETFYGPLDKGNPLSQRLKQEFLRRRLEVLRDDSIYLSENHESPETLSTNLEAGKTTILKLLSNDEAPLDPNPYSNQHSIEHFLLPRHYLTFENIVHAKSASSDISGCQEADGSSGRKPTYSREFSGLGILDPMLQPEKTLVKVMQTSNIGRSLCSALVRLVNNFPYGVKASRLKEIYVRITGYSIDWEEHGCSFISMFTQESDVVWIRNSPGLPKPLNQLLFPASLKGSIRNVETLLYGVWHRYMAMIAVLGCPIPVNSSCKLLYKFMGLQNNEFCVSNWGFDSAQHFVEYCFDYFQPQTFQLLVPIQNCNGRRQNKASLPLNNQPAPKLYVYHGGMWMSRQVPTGYRVHLQFGPGPQQNGISDALEDDQNLDTDEKEYIENVASILPEFPMANIALRLPWVTDTIQPGDTILCDQSLSLRPYSLSLLKMNDKIVYIALRKAMNKHFSSTRGRDGASGISNIPTGTLVAACYRKYWFRAIVVQENEQRRYYQLYFVDAAAFAKIQYRNVASIPAEFCRIPALGILSRLNIGNLGIENVSERKHRLQRLRRINLCGIWKVLFVRRDWIMGHSFWTVKINTAQMRVKETDKALSPRIRNFAGKENTSLIKPISRGRCIRGSKQKSEVVTNKVQRHFAGNTRRHRLESDSSQPGKLMTTFATLNCETNEENVEQEVVSPSN